MANPDEVLLTAEEAAAQLGVTRSYLYRLIKRGIISEAVGIRNGREVKLIPASALERLDAHEGLLVRDVDAGRPLGPEPWARPPLGPAAPAPRGAPARTGGGGAGPALGQPADAGPSMTPARPASDLAAPSPPSDLGGAASLTGQSRDSDLYLSLISELREELRSLRQQLTEERAARHELQAGLAQPAPATDELASALRRANEVTALVKASEIKHQRFFESMLEDRRWGRAKRIAYVVYLVITSAAGIAAVLWIYKIASHLENLLGR